MDITDVAPLCGLAVRGLIHVGANWGDERDIYRDAGIQPVVWVEPISSVFAALAQHVAGAPGQTAVQALCAERRGERVRLNIASNNGASSSILGLGRHGVLIPSVTYVGTEEFVTETLDHIVFNVVSDPHINAIVIDVQGAELKVLRGAAFALGMVDAVFLEVSEVPLYEGGCTLDEIIAYLGGFGFRLTWLELNRARFGDALFVYQPAFLPRQPPPGPNLALGRPTAQSSVFPGGAAPVAAAAPGGAAVSGRLSGRFAFHTEMEDRPWWQVDLGVAQSLRQIRVYNRGDMAAERARHLRVLLSPDGERWEVAHEQAGRVFGARDARRQPLLVDLPDGAAARLVRVDLAERGYLHLDQVEVY